MEIELRTIGNTPVFSIESSLPHWSRVYGATFIKKEQCWLFPAFPPFLKNVLHDIEKVHKDVSLSPKALQWTKSIKTPEEWLDAIKQLELPVKNYDHQAKGLAELLHNYRWILQWEMGTGKSKVVIDATNYLKVKALVLCPLIAAENWVKETKFHSDDSLKAFFLKGKSRVEKIEKLQQFEEQDILIVTYDTARTLGTPRIFPQTAHVFQKAMRFPHSSFKRILQRLNDESKQTQLAQEWLKGRPPREIKAEIQEITQGHPQWVLDLPYEMAVCDESHRIKHIQSRRTKVCLQLSQKASRRYLLSGTLAQGDPRDLFPQLKFLAPYLIPEDWDTFCKNYLEYSPWNNKIVIGYKNLHSLNARVKSISSERKLEECVDLPERRFETVYFTLSAAQRKNYNNIIRTNTIERAGNEEIEIANGAVRISKLLQLCSGFLYAPEENYACDHCPQVRKCVELGIYPGTNRCTNNTVTKEKRRISLRYPDNPKLAVLQEMLEDIVNSSKTIIWATFEQELDDVEEMLQKQKYGYVRVDGTTTNQIQKLVDKFNTEENCKVYLAQISTGIAITLNAAKYTIYYSRDWSLENRQQSLFRNFRIGQTQKTMVYDLCARGSLEVQQLVALQSKADISKLLTGQMDCTFCNKYKDCLEQRIAPWTTRCVLSTGVSKKIAKARMV